MNYVFKEVLKFERFVVATINRVCVCGNRFSTSMYVPPKLTVIKLAMMNCVIEDYVVFIKCRYPEPGWRELYNF